MSKLVGVLVIILSLAAGFGGGWVYQLTLGKAAQPTVTTQPAPTTTTQSLADCLKSVWGADKYALIQTNPNLATTQDNLAALKCYQS